MKVCKSCGLILDDLAVACPHCGAMQENGPAYTSDEAGALKQMDSLLKGERIAWKVCGIIGLIFGILFASGGLSTAFLGFLIGRTYDSPQSSDAVLVVLGTMGMIWFVIGLFVLLPCSIISLKMVPKVDFYRSKVYSDVSVARTRCTSIGMIVFCAIFNEVAAVFFILNFVRTKVRAATFDKIEEKQKKG